MLFVVLGEGWERKGIVRFSKMLQTASRKTYKLYVVMGNLDVTEIEIPNRTRML